MRIIKSSTLRRFWTNHRDAERELRAWIRITAAARWVSPAAVKQQFGARADFVKVASGNTVVVFDIANNRYRMIAAIHYDFPRVFILRIFTHAEYDRNRWKEEL
jgi:mRNA interferase HigB